MDNKGFDFLFDEKVKNEIKNSFDDIKFTSELKNKIKEEINVKRNLKDKIISLLNYEIEIPIGKIGVIAAILAIIPTVFTLHEGKKIMDNNVNYEDSITNYNKFKR